MQNLGFPIILLYGSTFLKGKSKNSHRSLKQFLVQNLLCFSISIISFDYANRKSASKHQVKVTN